MEEETKEWRGSALTYIHMRKLRGYIFLLLFDIFTLQMTLIYRRIKIGKDKINDLIKIKHDYDQS